MLVCNWTCGQFLSVSHCPPLPYIDQGNYSHSACNLTGVDHGQSCFLNCTTGYKYTDLSLASVECVDGQWSNSITNCTGIYHKTKKKMYDWNRWYWICCCIVAPFFHINYKQRCCYKQIGLVNQRFCLKEYKGSWLVSHVCYKGHICYMVFPLKRQCCNFEINVNYFYCQLSFVIYSIMLISG